MKSIITSALLTQSCRSSFTKLIPQIQVKNPVMFCVYIAAIYLSIALISGNMSGSEYVFNLQIIVWLWLTILFANFAESIAEGRGKAQADSLRKTRKDVLAKIIKDAEFDLPFDQIPASDLRKGMLLVVFAGEMIAGDGEVIKGAASVDESAITGESAPVIREAGGDRSSVTAGTTVLSDQIIVRVTKNPGETFLDQMISMVEGAKRQKTPNELALCVLLASMSIIFLVVCITLKIFADFSILIGGNNNPISITVLVALMVCLIPTTIGALLSAIGIAGMERLARQNIIALSGRAVEAAGNVDVLLLDKTGTITLGNRVAVRLISAEGVNDYQLAEAAYLASVADETPEGRSIVKLCKDKYKILESQYQTNDCRIVKFSAETRISGLDMGEASYRKGAVDAMKKLLNNIPHQLQQDTDSIAQQGATPLLVSIGNNVLGAVELKDMVKPGIKSRFSELRAMGIKTIMVTGDNPLTAASIAAEAGVDDFLAEATPEAKLKLIKEYQNGGRLVAMTGDGTNDAPALAQADVAVAMNAGTQAAKEAANMVDLDSDPTKLLEIVEIGKQILMTRGALTTFSISNDVAKYFAIIPAALAGIYPQLSVLNIMQLYSPQSAALSAIIFNAIIILLLIPVAMKGVKYKAEGAAEILRRHVLLYGLGGIVAPFIGIKLIDYLLISLRLL